MASPDQQYFRPRPLRQSSQSSIDTYNALLESGDISATSPPFSPSSPLSPYPEPEPEPKILKRPTPSRPVSAIYLGERELDQPINRGFASIQRVGLGSPKWEFGRGGRERETWVVRKGVDERGLNEEGMEERKVEERKVDEKDVVKDEAVGNGWADQGAGPAEEESVGNGLLDGAEEVLHADTIPRRSQEDGGILAQDESGKSPWVNSNSGLPSPPETESSIGPTSDTHRPNGQIKEDVTADRFEHRPATISRSSTTRVIPRRQPVEQTDASSSSSTPHLVPATAIPESPRRKTLRPKSKPSPSLSRTSSSSSALATEEITTARRDPIEEVTPARRYSTDVLRSPSHSSSSSQRKRQNGISTSSPHSSNGSYHSGSGSSSPTKRSHRHSPSEPIISSLSRRLSHRMSGSWLSEELIDEEGPNMSSERGDDVDDERIREAEEKLRGSTRRPRDSDLSDGKTTIRRHDSVSKATSPPQMDSSTLRRSATVLGARLSGDESRAHRRDHQDEGQRSYYEDEAGYHRNEAAYPDEEEPNRSGGSASSGKRKPLPADFRSSGSSLFTPSPKPPSGADQSYAEHQHSSSRSMRAYTSPMAEYQSSPIPNRFSTTSRLDGIPSPTRSRVFPRIEGLERSASSSLARVSPDLTSPRYHRALPQAAQNDRYRPESVLDTHQDRQRYISRLSNGSSDRASPLSNRGSGSRIGLTPGDSVSAIGTGYKTDVGFGTGYKSEVGAKKEKDPLEVLKRIEASRAEHNRQWEVDRAQSVLGNHIHERQRPHSRFSSAEVTPVRMRPATSLSSIRDRDRENGPRTAPVERFRRHFDQDRSSSRMSFTTHTNSEPRPMQSSTSIGARGGSDLVSTTGSGSEHGRLLLEAFRSMEGKLSTGGEASLSDLVEGLRSTTKSSESVNSSLRGLLPLVQSILTSIELEDMDTVKDDANRLGVGLREATRWSDQGVRDLTRVLLDLPRALPANGSGSGRFTGSIVSPRDVDAPTASGPGSRRWRPLSPETGTYRDSPIRRSEELSRATDMQSPTSRLSRQRDSLPAVALSNHNGGTSREHDRERSSSTMSNLASRFRIFTTATATGTGTGMGGSYSPRRSNEDLPPIEASPPNFHSESSSSNHHYDHINNDNNGLDRNTSSAPKSNVTSNTYSNTDIDSPTYSPRRPTSMLKKKASIVSTIRGSNFFPPAPKVRSTTAVSQVTVGDLSPGLGMKRGSMDSTSLRDGSNGFDGVRSGSHADRVNGTGFGNGLGNGDGIGNDGYGSGVGEGVGKGSPESQTLSYYTAQASDHSGAGSGIESGDGGRMGDGVDDAVGMLAGAAKRRELEALARNGVERSKGDRIGKGDADAEVVRRPSVSERLRVWRRG